MAKLAKKLIKIHFFLEELDLHNLTNINILLLKCINTSQDFLSFSLVNWEY